MDLIDPVQILKLIAALLFVVSLMGGLAFLLRRLGLADSITTQNKNQRRLHIIESKTVDSRRKIALIQCDDTQHLVLLGANGDTVIRTDIKPPKDHDSKNEEPSSTH